MKRIKFLIFGIIAALTFFACNDDKSSPNPEPIDTIVVADGSYSGILVVDYSGDEQTSVDTVQVITTNKEDSIVIFFKQVKFVSEMPFGLDIKVPVTCTAYSDSAALAGNNITPYLGDSPFPNFRIDNVDGMVNNDSLKFTMDMVALSAMGSLLPGTYPIKFAGALIK